MYWSKAPNDSIQLHLKLTVVSIGLDIGRHLGYGTIYWPISYWGNIKQYVSAFIHGFFNLDNGLEPNFLAQTHLFLSFELQSGFTL